MKDKNIFRNHPLSILTHNRIGIVALLIVYNFIKNFFKESMKKGSIQSLDSPKISNIYIAIGVFSIIFIAFLYEFFVYKNTTIEITDINITYNKKGIFLRNTRTTPIEHISNINIENNIIDGLFGLKKISMDTNSATSVKQTDFSMIVKNETAIEIKNLINNAKKENENYIFETEIDEINDRHIIKDFSKKEIIRHIILSLNIVPIIIAIGGFIATIPTKFISKTQILLYLGAIVIYFITFFIKKLNSFNNLTIIRKENEIELSYGFLKKEQFSVPINKIQSISCEQSFLARIFGYFMYKITVIGVGNSKEETNSINLYMKEKDLLPYMKEILPEFNIDNNLEEQDKNYKKYLVIYHLILAIIYTPILIYKKLWYISIGLLILSLIIIIIFSKYNSISILKDRIVFKRGLFSTITNTIYYKKIDTVCIEKNILANFLKIEKLKISYKGTLGKDTITSGYYKNGYFEKIIEFYRNGEYKLQ